jgi:hypothetical protein
VLIACAVLGRTVLSCRLVLTCMPMLACQQHYYH